MQTASLEGITSEPDRQIAEIVSREASRLRRFIRRRVPDPRDAEDILQDVFYKLVEANRLLMPIDHATGWLFRVARNRIADLFRERKRQRVDTASGDREPRLTDDLPAPADAGPDALLVRGRLFEAFESALAELPLEQREVFVGHELEGHSFKDMSVETGVSVNTLLSRKRYAVLRLRARLQRTFDDFTKPREK